MVLISQPKKCKLPNPLQNNLIMNNKKCSKWRCSSNNLEVVKWMHQLTRKLKTCKWQRQCNNERYIELNRSKHNEPRDIMGVREMLMEGIAKGSKWCSNRNNSNIDRDAQLAWLMMTPKITKKVIQTSGNSEMKNLIKDLKEIRKKVVDFSHSLIVACQKNLRKMLNLKRVRRGQWKDLPCNRGRRWI